MIKLKLALNLFLIIVSITGPPGSPGNLGNPGPSGMIVSGILF